MQEAFREQFTDSIAGEGITLGAGQSHGTQGLCFNPYTFLDFGQTALSCPHLGSLMTMTKFSSHKSVQ